MMTRQERAKQFMPFDAMKGLQEALRLREAIHDRHARPELLPEAVEENDRILRSISVGDLMRVCFYADQHVSECSGTVTHIDPERRLLTLGGTVIPFDDICRAEREYL